MTETSEHPVMHLHRTFVLWYGVLVGPVVWLIHLFVSYGLATILCSPEQIPLLHGAMGVALVLSLSSIVVGMRARRQMYDLAQERPETVSLRRARFLALFAICNGIIFSLAIVAQSLPNFFFDSCRAMG